ncbi:MAG: GNAT family N-acetyltransferase [Oscillospiraceae bacterium]|nr:GNAT family N-acetyltransferase [Oscillospiraceae bacterium]
MNIRRAESRDIPGMIALLYQVGEVHHVIRPDIFRSGALKYDEKALEALLQDETKPIFVADIEGFVAGYCFCQLRSYDGTGVSTSRKELYIDDLCVDENRRGQHIGSVLYDHAVSYAKEIGCQFLTLNVWCGNDSAMKFYEKAGLTKRNIMMETKLC